MTEAGSNLRDLALEYATRGWRVFPIHYPLEDGSCSCGNAACEDIGKHPRTRRGCLDATTSRGDILALWRNALAANIGLATGAESGVVVLDVDGEVGADTLHELERKHGKLPDTIEAKTGSGGRHILFKHPGVKVKNSVRDLGDGLDVRGDGGYIVLAPSLHRSGNRYSWEIGFGPGEIELAELPQWLFERIVQGRVEGLAKPADKMVVIGDFIPEGRRNDLLTRLAGRARRLGMSESEVLAVLRDANEKRCEGELPDSELQGIAHNSQAWDPDRSEVAKITRAGEVGTVIEDLKAIGDPKMILKRALEPEAVGALALKRAESVAAFEALKVELGEKGVKAKDVAAIERAVKAEQRKASGIHVVKGEEVLAAVLGALPSAPVTKEMVIPSGYRLGENGVYRERKMSDGDGGERTSLSPIASTPIVIGGRLANVADGTESLRLGWLRDGHWKAATVSRAILANTRQIVDLAGLGFPVNSGTAADVVEYLAAYEAANILLLPRANVSSQLGWQGDKLDAFLWGRTLLRKGADQTAEIDLEAMNPADWQEDWVAFRGDDVGDNQIASAYRAQGSLSGWLEAVSHVGDYPRVALALYAALATPLLKVLGAQNFVLDFAYSTSTGKSTALRAAASVWGCPDERAAAAAIGTWDASRVWVERSSAVLNGLPLILDDTKRVKNPKQISQIVYDIVQGKGRGRGSVGGTRTTKAWQTIMLSTGEQPLVAFCENDGGAHARILSCWGLPFGKANAATAQIVRELNRGVIANYGHAGPALVHWLLDHKEKSGEADDRVTWDDLRAEHLRLTEEYARKAGDNAVGGRQAEFFATLHLAAFVAHAAIALPWDFHDPLEHLADEFIAQSAQADRATAALDYVMEWAKGNQNFFMGREEKDFHEKPRHPGGSGWAGRWERDRNNERWDAVHWIESRVKAVLKEGGFEADATLRTWSDRGWLLCDKGRKGHQVRLGVNHDDRFYAISLIRGVIDQSSIGEVDGNE